MLSRDRINIWFIKHQFTFEKEKVQLKIKLEKLPNNTSYLYTYAYKGDYRNVVCDVGTKSNIDSFFGTQTQTKYPNKNMADLSWHFEKCVWFCWQVTLLTNSTNQPMRISLSSPRCCSRSPSFWNCHWHIIQSCMTISAFYRCEQSLSDENSLKYIFEMIILILLAFIYLLMFRNTTLDNWNNFIWIQIHFSS